MKRKDVLKKVAFISGASSGIGKAVGNALIERNYTVYGTTRRRIIGCELLNSPPLDFYLLTMDVNDEASVENAIALVMAKEGRIDLFVSCAGYGLAGAVEETTVQESKDQFNTNFFGTLAVLNRIVPIMRSQEEGRIVVIGSVAAYIPLPFQSMYCASKYALEAMTESLRMEVAPFNIKVSIVEPGDINTEFTNNRRFTKQSQNLGSAYRNRCDKAVGEMVKSEQAASGPDEVVKVVLKHISKQTPPVRTSVGLSYKFVYLLKRVLPGRLLHFILTRLY